MCSRLQETDPQLDGGFRFVMTGYPQLNHPFRDGIFPDHPAILWGTAMASWNPPKMGEFCFRWTEMRTQRGENDGTWLNLLMEMEGENAGFSFSPGWCPISVRTAFRFFFF